MELMDETLGLADALQQANVPFAICGGIAMSLHGFTRYTQDIDLLVRPDDLPNVLAVAGKLGFIFPARPMKFAPGTPNEIQIRRVSKVVESEYLVLDLILAEKVLEDVWETRGNYSLKDRTVPAVSVEGLAKMKRLAGRDQDIVDLKRLGFTDE